MVGIISPIGSCDKLIILLQNRKDQGNISTILFKSFIRFSAILQHSWRGYNPIIS